MDNKISVIPEIGEINRYARLAVQYDLSFEYNDFYRPKVYDDPDEISRRIEIYRSLERDRKDDTLHGVFYDIAFTSMDPVIRKRSRELMEQSVSIAGQLGCKGVVFHSGLISGLDTEEYCKSWLRDAQEFLSGLAASNPEIIVFLENTFEKTPDILVDFMESVSDVPNLRICLDYAHACLVTDRTEEWFSTLAKYIGHIHINDNDLRSDLHLSLGDGKIDLVRFKSLLDRYKPDCNILLEVSGYDRTVKSLEKIRSL